MRHTVNVNERETERHLLWWVKFVENRKTHQPLHFVYFQRASSACSNHLSLSCLTDKSVAFKWLSACKWAKTVKVDEQINKENPPNKKNFAWKQNLNCGSACERWGFFSSLLFAQSVVCIFVIDSLSFVVNLLCRKCLLLQLPVQMTAPLIAINAQMTVSSMTF